LVFTLQQSNSGIGDTDVTIKASALSSSITEGHLLVAVIGLNASDRNVTSNDGWTAGTASVGTAGAAGTYDRFVQMWYKVAVASENTQPTWTHDGAAGPRWSICIAQFSYDTTCALDIEGSVSTADSVTHTTPSKHPHAGIQSIAICGFVLVSNGNLNNSTWSGESASGTNAAAAVEVVERAGAVTSHTSSCLAYTQISQSTGSYSMDNTAATSLAGATAIMIFNTGNPIALDGTQPGASGAASRIGHGHKTTTGTQPSASGSVSRSRLRLASLTGTQPSASGVITKIRNRLYSLTGAQPSMSGAVVSLLVTVRGSDGTQPSATGELTIGVHENHRSLSGTQPSASGIISKVSAFYRSITGTQPGATGEGRPRYNWTSTLTGLQPEMSGLCHFNSPPRDQDSTQPAASGTISWIKYHLGKRIVSVDATPLND